MKKLNLANKIIAGLLSIVAIIAVIVTHHYSCLIYIIFLIVPFIFKLHALITILYIVFTFIAYFLGIALTLYKTTIWFDGVTHFAWGLLSSLLAIFTLKKFHMYDKKHLFFNTVFIVIFSAASSCLWEMVEFAVDHLFNMNMQRVETGNFDTMKDIIVAFIGNVLFVTWYLYENIAHKKGLITMFEENLDKE